MRRTVSAADLRPGQTFRVGEHTRPHTVATVERRNLAYHGPSLVITDTDGREVIVAWNAWVTVEGR